MLRYITIAFLLLTSFPTLAQSSYEPGQQIKDYTLQDFMNYPHKTRKLSDLRGKYVILDFWSLYCSPCIGSFPKMDSLALKYKKDVEIIMVGVFRAKDLQETKALYRKQTDRYGLKLPTVYDTLMQRDFEFSGVGSSVVLDRNGKIIAMPLAHLITDSVLQRLVSGKTVELPSRVTASQRRGSEDAMQKGEYRLQEDFSRILYRSVLTAAQPSFPMANASFHVRDNKYGVRMFNISARQMYQRVYNDRGTHFKGSRVVLEMAHPARLSDSLYCYELIITDERYPDRMLHAQGELDRALRLTSCIEKRRMPCLVLTAPDTMRLRTAGAESAMEGIDRGASGIRFINRPIAEILGVLHNAFIEYKPMVDETGITGNVDMNLELDNSKPKIIRYREALEKAGFRLEEAERETEVLVIRDALPH